MNRALFLSIRPKYVRRIIGGLKRIEFRRICPTIGVGDLLFIYASSPQRELQCHCVIREVSSGTPESLWDKFNGTSGLTRAEFYAYFLGAKVGFAIHLGPITMFDQPVTLSSLREMWPGFSPPQIYRYLTKEEYSDLFTRIGARSGWNGCLGLGSSASAGVGM
jgi:predicted transcriptional regulator